MSVTLFKVVKEPAIDGSKHDFPLTQSLKEKRIIMYNY